MHIARGFTLIELMIVVAIIAILAAIAIPAYQDFAVRAKLSEGYSLAMSVRDAVDSAYAGGSMAGVAATSLDYPSGNKSTASKYVSYITVSNTGVITVTYAASANNGIPAGLNGKTMTLTPQIATAGGYIALADGTETRVDWACASATHVTADKRGMLSTVGSMPAKYMPSECR